MRTHILVCTGGGCIASGALEVSAAPREQLERHGLANEVRVIESGCLGPCAVGPVAAVYPDNVFYQGIRPDDAADIVEEHLLKGRVVERLVDTTLAGRALPGLREVPFFQKQVKIVLRNCGVIDPLKIEEYIARRLPRPGQGPHGHDARGGHRRDEGVGAAGARASSPA